VKCKSCPTTGDGFFNIFLRFITNGFDGTQTPAVRFKKPGLLAHCFTDVVFISGDHPEYLFIPQA
jgi:hypothetical protein